VKIFLARLELLKQSLVLLVYEEQQLLMYIKKNPVFLLLDIDHVALSGYET
jgi:hypothetical protein